MRTGLWSQIKTVALTDVAVLVKGIDREHLDDVERILVEADFGSRAMDLVEHLETEIRAGRLKTEAAVRNWLIESVASTFASQGETFGIQLAEEGPTVVVMLGVNGVGKTTQAAKLAHRCQREGRSVLLAAADTFRAGAAEQLQIWADRLGVDCVTGSAKGDPAAVAFDAVEAAVARDVDVVIVDTAGRLHTQQDLVAELQKIVRVVGRKIPGAPHETFLVLDGTTGQNAIRQGTVFLEATPLTGIIMTKMDGTARGGAVISVHETLGVPVRFVGVGEGLDDLEVFDARWFAERLIGS